jgi:hypothetical protein
LDAIAFGKAVYFYGERHDEAWTFAIALERT